MTPPGPRAGSVRAKLVVNTALAISFVALSLPAVTRIALHEWWSFAFCLIVALHLLFSWNWIVNVTRRIVAPLRGEVRFNYVWDLLLYATLAVVMVSGVVVSEVALPQMGIAHRPDRFWSRMHSVSSDAMLVMVGVHLAMHWDWVTAALGRLVSGTLSRPAARPDAATWWIRPTGMIAGSALILSVVTLVMGFTPQAERVRARGRPPRPAPTAQVPSQAPAQAPAPTLGQAPAPVTSPPSTAPATIGGAPVVAGTAQETSRARVRMAPQAPPRVSLRIRLLRGGRYLAIYMGLPFIATLTALAALGRLRRAKRAMGDPLEQRAA